MRISRYPSLSYLRSPSNQPSFAACLAVVYLNLGSSFSSLRHRRIDSDHFQKNATEYWNKFYQRHQNKFFKDRHYLVKDWGHYFSDDDTSSKGNVALEVGCGAGNTIFPLINAYPNLFFHACDASPNAISLVKSHIDYREDKVNAFVCDLMNEDPCDKILPSSVDVVTLVFMLSAVSPGKMPLILESLRPLLKPNGCILLRDYAVGDFAQIKLHEKNRMIEKNFYIRGDGTCSYFFSEEFLSTLFKRAGFKIADVHVYCKQIENRSRNLSMNRRWIRAAFSSPGCSS
ncbi:hypothetical protein Nepgr_023883 [Nepenthes gracilis]|uniref:tRNA N(3)-methylcytidine methyltransferase n=1 Tax=Nepenthes gracilis TaxID=150966 RepID=A0AAD3T262_NEPGR|nr:hypothetical protein Nepgr_023883 [Nepenthes gracilis]